MIPATLERYIPWSLRGIDPFLKRYGDGLLFRSIAKTKPIETNPEADTGIHSAVPHQYVFAYLTAIKSFLRFWSDVTVFVHDDGSLRTEDKALIQAHIKGVRIIDRPVADREFAARVGDEFLSMVRSSYTSYLKLFDPTLVSTKRRIIIVDTDVLFLRHPSAVITWGQEGGSPWYHKSLPWKAKPADSAQNKPVLVAPPPKSTHIQQLVLQRLADINQNLGTNLAFVPGFNSGLIGYEHGIVDYGELKKVLSHLYELLGDRIFRWGAEQTMHGLILCAKGATALPSDEYMVYTKLNSTQVDQATFIHFIGEFRFYRFKYPLLAAKVIRQLRGDQ